MIKTAASWSFLAVSAYAAAGNFVPLPYALAVLDLAKWIIAGATVLALLCLVAWMAERDAERTESNQNNNGSKAHGDIYVTINVIGDGDGASRIARSVINSAERIPHIIEHVTTSD